MTQTEIRAKISEIRGLAEGTFFSVQFIKKNGDVRDMVCRLGVKKGVTGEGMKYDPSDVKYGGLLPVFDVQKNAFRMINLSTITKLQIKGNRLV